MAGGNGVYGYGPVGTFPTATFNATSYWVDVLFEVNRPTSISVAPANASIPADATRQFTAVALYAGDTTRDVTAAVDWASSSATVATIDPTGVASPIAQGVTTISASLVGVLGSTPLTVTAPIGGTLSSITIDPGPRSVETGQALRLTATAHFAAGGTQDVTQEAIWSSGSADVASVDGWGRVSGWREGSASISASLQGIAGSATVAVTQSAAPSPEGPGGPILVVSSAANPFSRYLAEILRAEGLNEFLAVDVSAVDAVLLSGYDVVVLGDMPLSAAQVAMFGSWVSGGGHLVAMRPDKQLAPLLGLVDAAATLADAYLLVDTGSAPGAGLVAESVQFHGTADRYTLDPLGLPSVVAALYATASTSAGET